MEFQVKTASPSSHDGWESWADNTVTKVTSIKSFKEVHNVACSMNFPFSLLRYIGFYYCKVLGRINLDISRNCEEITVFIRTGDTWKRPQTLVRRNYCFWTRSGWKKTLTQPIIFGYFECRRKNYFMHISFLIESLWFWEVRRSRMRRVYLTRNHNFFRDQILSQLRPHR